MKTFISFFILQFALYATFAQYSISGKITDETGQALIGANVHIKNTSMGTISDKNGNFSIHHLEKNEYILVVSYLGYEKTEKTINLEKDLLLNIQMQQSTLQTEEFIVSSTRANANTPTTYTTLEKEAIEEQNLGQDIPFLLSQEPSLVSTSDAGAGIGYTGMWIRGSNIQRINVTINGIPLNDPESHGVFWVNMPDFSSSLNSIQIQRGVGTSTNGGGAFGATINLETNTLEKEAFADINSSAGSFNTFKNNVRFGSGLIHKHWAFEGRLSKIQSDGYIDRAESDLKSFFLQGGYYAENTILKAIIFSGKEKTYQAWYGIDNWTAENYGRTFNWAGAIFNDDGSIRYYDNQTDNYQQDHYQLHLSQELSSAMNFNAALHYTYGRGYYEEYFQGRDLMNYGIEYQYFGYDSVLTGNTYHYFYKDTVKFSDLVTRRWLDNHFYGATYALNYKYDKLKATIGGAINDYANARHFGEVIWAQFTGDLTNTDKYYDNVSNKSDINNYIKLNYQLFARLNLFADLQLRVVDYTGEGTDSDGSEIAIQEKYNFFNPKIGLSYDFQAIGTLYSSFAIANREPIRTDFLDAPDGIVPEPEKLSDFEFGMRNSRLGSFYNANFYYMKYTNQLVLTGEINDVGSPIRANAGESSRLGIELDGGCRPVRKITLRANLALSTSSTDYKEAIEDDAGQSEIIHYDDVQISFSPQFIAGGLITIKPVKNGEITLTGKYVSKQYLDLTENNERSLDAYFKTDLRLNYSINPGFMRSIELVLLINNVSNNMYAANGYVYYGTPYYYPQAGINFLAGLNLKF